MIIDKRLIYVNLCALAINGIVVLTVTIRVFPLVAGVLAMLCCFGGAIWLSCRINGKL